MLELQVDRLIPMPQTLQPLFDPGEHPVARGHSGKCEVQPAVPERALKFQMGVQSRLGLSHSHGCLNDEQHRFRGAGDGLGDRLLKVIGRERKSLVERHRLGRQR